MLLMRIETKQKMSISDQMGRALHISRKENLLQNNHVALGNSICLSQKILGYMTRKKKVFSKK